LSESIVEEAATSASDPVEISVKDAPAVLVLVKAQMQEVVKKSCGL